jgi:pantoate--beta-alanine ligase
MQIISGIPEIRSALRELRRQGNVGLVPTMGALHEGHLSLVRASRNRCRVSVVSIFVNPTQFGPQEDFSRYPRTLDEDCKVLESEGVDIVFAPDVRTMYPQGASTFVEVAEIGNRLDGASRPGHFRGVATVVAKLFHIVQPDVAFFGQKDAAQVAVLRRMVRDLDFPLELAVCPIVREPDGLALSSRNRYLSATERVQALALRRAMELAEKLAEGGEYRGSALVEAMTTVLREAEGVRVDYVAAVSPDTLLPVEDVRAGGLLAVAAWVGNTRLIDNILLSPSR